MGNVSFTNEILPLLVRFCKVDYKKPGEEEGKGHEEHDEHEEDEEDEHPHAALMDYKTLMATDFVKPGDAENSELYQAVTGTGSFEGFRMPLDGPYFTDGECNLIKQWINEGAKDDSNDKKTVIIMGGGAAGLAAGVTLIEQGFDVTILTEGHRLGGKAQSWRDPKVDPASTWHDVPDHQKGKYDQRKAEGKYVGPAIVNHGFHAVFGFYYNFIDILKRVGAYKNLVPNDHKFNMQSGGKFHKVRFLSAPFPFHLLGMLFYTGFSLFQKIRYSIWGFNIFRRYPETFLKQDYNAFATWSRGKGLNDESLRNPFFRMTQEGDFNFPRSLSGFVGLKGILEMIKDYRATGMYYFNGGITEVLWEPIADYFTSKGGNLIYFQKVIQLNHDDTKITSIVAAKPICHRGGPWLNGTVQIQPETAKEYTADYYISTLPLECLKELNVGDRQLWSQEYFRNIWAFDTVPTYAYCVWLKEMVTPPELRRDCIVGIEEPFATMMDYKEVIDEYRNDPNVGSVLDMVAGQGSFKRELTPDGKQKGGWTEEELKDLALNNLSKYDAFKKVRNNPDDPNSGFNKDLILYDEFHENGDHFNIFFLPTPKTYKCRPENRTPYTNMRMAGDWVKNEYMPVISIEGATISGKMAANTILEDEGKKPVEILVGRDPFLLRVMRFFFSNNLKAIISFTLLFLFLAMMSGCLTGVGDYKSNISVVEMQKSDVENMLPSGVSLNSDPSKTTHPVVFVYGQQSNVVAKLSILGFDIFIPTFFENYNEMIVGIPYARYSGMNTDFIYMPILRLDNFWAIVAGHFYGFNKQEAKFNITDAEYEVLKKASAGQKPLAKSMNDNLPIVADPSWIAKTFDQPLLGFALGIPVCSFMNWNFNDATMKEDRMTMHVSPELVKGMPEINMSVLPVNPTGLGAFYLHNNWELTVPNYGCFGYN